MKFEAPATRQNISHGGTELTKTHGGRQARVGARAACEWADVIGGRKQHLISCCLPPPIATAHHAGRRPAPNPRRRVDRLAALQSSCRSCPPAHPADI